MYGLLICFTKYTLLLQAHYFHNDFVVLPSFFAPAVTEALKRNIDLHLHKGKWKYIGVHEEDREKDQRKIRDVSGWKPVKEMVNIMMQEIPFLQGLSFKDASIIEGGLEPQRPHIDSGTKKGLLVEIAILSKHM